MSLSSMKNKIKHIMYSHYSHLKNGLKLILKYLQIWEICKHYNLIIFKINPKYLLKSVYSLLY